MPLNYNRTLTDEEVKFLEYDLINVRDWIDKAIDGKINNCMKRAASEYRMVASKENIATIPAMEKVAANALIARPDYKNRAQRDQSERTH